MPEWDMTPGTWAGVIGKHWARSESGNVSIPEQCPSDQLQFDRHLRRVSDLIDNHVVVTLMMLRPPIHPVTPNIITLCRCCMWRLCASASYTVNEMFLQWDKDERRMIAKDISILPLVVENITLSDNCTYTEIIGNLSCLNITFKLCRRMSASDIQMYVSSGLLSGLSCIAFLIPVDKTPARAGIGITTTISVITQCANAHANMPKVSYMTAMDIWMTGCLSFIVCTFIVNILETSFCHNKKDNSAQTEGVGQTQADEEDPSHSGSAAAQDDDENRGGEPPIASSCDRLGAAVGCLKKVLRAIFCKHKLFVLSLFIFSTLIIIYFVLNNKC
ncbi:uncharacterized protein LOC142907240 isoform X2 [Petromyzon marinus]|uniref:uncharacterized protein LOC142907240 isoform X2 n=1 Tax=Petromyzon marinus TaxID=7757 RepID=UPI003F729631